MAHTLLHAVIPVLVSPATTISESVTVPGVWVVVELGEGGAAGPGVGLHHAVICTAPHSNTQHQLLDFTGFLYFCVWKHFSLLRTNKMFLHTIKVFS